MTEKIRVFSGIRPTNILNIGNYLGAIKGWLEFQERPDLDCLYSAVDLHGITSPYESKKYQNQIQELVLEYLAVGIDPNKSHIFIQSQVPEHIELAYYLSTIYPVSRLEQLPTYKDKKQEQPRYINMGLLYYPVLMAADILIYKAKLVPVGKDQLPHIEVAREMARSFNKSFGQTFPEPQAHLMKGAYIPSLTGEGKMSKSKPDSFISLLDDLKTIEKKLAKVPTDNGHDKVLPKEGGVLSLLNFVELFQGLEKKQEYEKLYLTTGLQYGDLKKDLAKSIYQELQPIQEKRNYYADRPKEVAEILEDGRKYASNIARETLKEVKEKMGLTSNG
ncbi:MAG: tryptophan--tRNA ligase [Candidatus Parcubacteria bacterium]|nr:tryptophan--tRNA ligase [Candidatus Parcubacteria bacterium]